MTLRVVTSPYFLGTKLEAFFGRGNGDFVASRDREGIVAVIDGRLAVVEEISIAEEDNRPYLAKAITRLMRESRFLEALPGHVPGDMASLGRLPIIQERMTRISLMNT
jgi:hypothetical protein